MRKLFIKAHIIIGIILLCVALFFFIQIVQYLKIGAVKNVQTFAEPKVLYGNEKCYQNNQHLYILDDTTGTIHIFNKNGKFLNGIQLPTSGGDVWSGMGNTFYAYSVRNNLLVEVFDTGNISQKNSYFSNPNDFYDSLNIFEKNGIDVDGNMVSMTNNENTVVILDIKTSALPIDLCTILFFICMLVFLAVTMKINIKERFNKLYK